MKAWAIIYNDKVIFETVRRTRRECISAFMQDKDLDNIKWSDRYSDRTASAWSARNNLPRVLMSLKSPARKRAKAGIALMNCHMAAPHSAAPRDRY